MDLSQEDVTARLLSLCLVLFARTKALGDLLQEAYGEIDEEAVTAAVERRLKSLPTDLRADGFADPFWEIIVAAFDEGRQGGAPGR